MEPGTTWRVFLTCQVMVLTVGWHLSWALQEHVHVASSHDLSIPTSRQLDLFHGSLGSSGGCPKRPKQKLPGLLDLVCLLPSPTGAVRHLSRFKGRRMNPASRWLEVRDSVGMFAKHSGQRGEASKWRPGSLGGVGGGVKVPVTREGLRGEVSPEEGGRSGEKLGEVRDLGTRNRKTWVLEGACGLG